MAATIVCILATGSIQSANVVVLGLGYTGSAICRALLEQGCTVAGSCRTEAAAAEARERLGLDAFALLDATSIGLSNAATATLSRATHVVSTIPPVDGVDAVLLHAADTLRDRAVGRGGGLRWIGYLSTTSVYGDHEGGWVDESSETRAPAGSSARARLDTEAQWRALAAESEGVRACIFRLAGIYGPTRSAINTLQRNGQESEADLAPGNPISRVHVDDIAGVVVAALGKELHGVYNLADHQPAPRAEVMRLSATLLSTIVGASPPATASTAPTGRVPSERSRRRRSESKRVCGDKLRRDADYEFKYPTYTSGLTAIAEQLAVAAAHGRA
jgi:nucleoside-diphosphate-sugar epimerase